MKFKRMEEEIERKGKGKGLKRTRKNEEKVKETTGEWFEKEEEGKKVTGRERTKEQERKGFWKGR